MEKLQRFSIRKLSIGAVSCLIGTVSFLSYSYKVQAAETPQTVETAKTDNEIKSENVQESKPNEEVKGVTQNEAVDKNTGRSQKTGALTTVNQTSPKENALAANEAKQNIADLAISTKMKLQAIRLAKPVAVNKINASPKLVQTVSPEQPANATDAQPVSDQSESAAVNSNALENNGRAASAPIALPKQPANADTPLAATTSGVQPFLNLAVESDNNDLTPKHETVGSQWRIHYIDSTNHEHELKAPTVINLQYARTNTPQSDGTIQHGDWSYVQGSFKQTGTQITVNDSDNPVKKDNVDKDGKNYDMFTITAMYPTVAGYNFHNGTNNTRLHDYLLNYDPNGNIQMPTMGQDFYVEYDPIGERSVAVKFVDDQSFDFDTSDHKKQVGQAITLTGHDGDTVNLKLTVPDKYQLAKGQQLPTTYTFAKGSGDLKIHLVHKVVQREATIDVKLMLMTLVDFGNNGYEPAVVTQARWAQLKEEEEAKAGSVSPEDVISTGLTEVGTLTGHVGYDLVDEEAVSFGDDWTSLNLVGRTYQLPNGTDVVNGILMDSEDTMGKKPKEYYLNEYRNWDSNKHVDPDYVNRPWHGYLSVNATNSTQTPRSEDVIRAGLLAGLAGNESNILAKATGDRAATAVEMANKTIDVNWLQDNLDFGARDFSEHNGQLKAKTDWEAFEVYIPYVEKTATRTINVTTPDGKTATVKQTATLAKQVDFGKDAHPAWTTGEWANYDVPAIPGYTASQSQIAKEAVTGTTEDQTVNITYTANDGTQTIVYQDEDGSEIDKQVISGKTDEKVKVTSDVPDGYVLKGEIPSEVTIKPDDTPITVTVEHGKSHVTPDKPVNKGDLIPDTKDKHYPEGLTHNDLNKTITRTVDITDPSGKKTTSVQTVTFTRGATVDDVTGEVAYDNWSENGKHTFDAVNVPYVTGYRASEEVPKVTVTPDSKSNTVNVTYVAKTYDVYVFYIYKTPIDNREDFDKHANGELGIAKPEILRGHYGEPINVPIKQVPGYYVNPYGHYSNYKFGIDNVTGQELSWYNFSLKGPKDLKDPLPEDASDWDKNHSMPRYIPVVYIKDFDDNGYNTRGYNIGYVDTEGAVISRPTNLRGISGTDTNFTAPTFAGYTLTNPQDVPAKFGKTSQDIFLVYKPQDVKVTYHYVDETGKQLVPSYIENNHFTGLTHVDQKDAKTIPGYSLVSTSNQTVVDSLKDLDLYFTYKANYGSQTISYQDNGQEVGKQVITGKTDQTVKVTPELPDGYVVKSEIPKEVTIKAKDDPIVIAVEHGKSHVTPDKPVNKGDLIPGTKDKHYPEGLTHDDLNKTVTREVTITDPTGKKSTTAQTVTFARGATVDEVTNKVTYDDWSENGKHTFNKVDVPTVPGYTVSGEVPEVVVTPETQSSKVDITYTANAQTAMITYVDDTTGKTLHTDKLDGVSDQDTKYATGDIIKQYADLHYKLVSDSTKGKDLIFDHDDQTDQSYEVHFVHGSHDISDKKSITETITYTMSDGSTAPNKVEKQVEFNRVGKRDDVTSTDTWNKWQPNKQSFSVVPTPEVKGYTPDTKSVGAKIVTADDKDITETITYSPDQQKAKVVFIDDTTKKTLDTHNLTGVTNSHEKYSPSEEIEKFIHDNYVFVSSDYPEKGFTYDNDDGQDQVFEVHFKERPTESDTPAVPGNTEDNGGSNDTPTVSDEPEKDNSGSDTVDKSGHKTPVKRNSNKKHHGTKKITNHKNTNKKHQGTKMTNNQKTSKTAKLNPNEVNTKANKLTQTKLGKTKESTNDTLPQTGNKQSSLMTALGLAISSLGMIGAVKSKKRKDNQ